MKKLDIMFDCGMFGFAVGITIFMIVQLIVDCIASSEASFELTFIGLIIVSSGSGIVGGRIIVDVAHYKKQLLEGVNNQEIEELKKKVEYLEQKLEKSN